MEVDCAVHRVHGKEYVKMGVREKRNRRAINFAGQPQQDNKNNTLHTIAANM